jgi:hypothetical protein
MLIVTGIEAEVVRCNLRCSCGRQFVENDFSDVDNVMTLKCGGLHGWGGGCGATPLAIVFGSDHARGLWGEEHAYAEGEEAMYEQPSTNTKIAKEMEMVQQRFDEFERAGLLRRTGELRNGQPVYVATGKALGAGEDGQ